ncbi:MAG: DUF4124 domain-containing protein [Duganella sp.]
MTTTNPIKGGAAALLLCVMCAGLGAAGSAQAQVNRCVNAEGQVTLTDEPCPQNSRAVNDDVSDNGAVGTAYNTGIDHVLPAAPVADLPRSRWADLPRPLIRKAAGTDATTLQTARTTLLMRDELRRQSRAVVTR